MSANTPLINEAATKLAHIEKSATAKAVKAIPLGFRSLKKGQTLIMILLFGLLSIVIVQQNQVLDMVRAWKKESRDTNVMLSGWMHRRELMMQASYDANLREQKELTQKRYKLIKHIHTEFNELRNTVVTTGKNLGQTSENINLAIESTAADLYARMQILEQTATRHDMALFDQRNGDSM